MYLQTVHSHCYIVLLCNYTIIYLFFLLVDHWFLAFSITNSVARNTLAPFLMNVFPIKGPPKPLPPVAFPCKRPVWAQAAYFLKIF